MEGTLAADSLIQAPRRTSGTVAALMLSLALVISLGGLARASYDSISEWMRIALNPDLFVTTAENHHRAQLRVSGIAGDGLRAIDGVAEVQTGAQRAGTGERHADHAASRPMWARSERHAQACPPWKATTPNNVPRWPPNGKGVIASENFARLHGAHLGEIARDSGALRNPAPAHRRAGARFLGSTRQPAHVARRVHARLERRFSDIVFRIYLQPGADEARVRQRILDAYGSRQRLFVLTNREVRGYITQADRSVVRI